MISLIDIKNTLGETTQILREICQSNNINKWSLYKPVTYDKRGQLTVEDFDSINYGYTDYHYIYNFDKNSRATLWDYSPRTSPYRMSDFKNYNHYSKFIDFQNSWDSQIIIGQQIRCSIVGDINYIVNHFDAFRSARTSSTPIYLCILLLGNNYNYIYKVCNVNNYDGDDIRIGTGYMDFGDYTVMPILTNNTQVNNMSDGNITLFNNNNGQYWLFPTYCEFEISIVDRPSSDFFDEVDFNFSNVNFDYDNYYMISFSVLCEIINRSGQYRHITLNINYSNTTQGTVTLSTRTVNLDSNTTTDVSTMTMQQNYIETVTDAQLYDGIISVIIDASISDGNISQQKQWAVILEKE